MVFERLEIESNPREMKGVGLYSSRFSVQFHTCGAFEGQARHIIDKRTVERGMKSEEDRTFGGPSASCGSDGGVQCAQQRLHVCVLRCNILKVVAHDNPNTVWPENRV